MELPTLKTIVHRFYSDVWNKHDKSAIPNLLQPDFTFRGSLGQCKTGHSEFADYVDFVHQALGAYQCDILDLVTEGNQCFARMRFSGNHHGEFFGFKPTGKKIEWAGAALFTQCAESLGVQPEVKSADAESGLAGLLVNL